MRKYPIEQYRNIGFIAHISAGKTTTTTCVLYYTGRIHKIGTLEKGTTPLDWMIQERERAMTIMAAATSCYWKVGEKEYQINIIDTPGHIDFTAEVQRSLRVLDGAIVVFDGGAGVQTQSETVWHQADNFSVPRICFVNKMDKVGATMEMNLESIWRRLSKNAIPLQIPIGLEDNFSGLVDLIKMKALRFEGKEGEIVKEEEIPKDLIEKAKDWRKRIIEKVAAEDEEILEKYLSGKEITAEDLRNGIRRATLKCKIFPVFFGSLYKRIGVQPLLDGICYYLPSPIDLPPVKGIDPKTGKEIERKPDDKEPFCALVFKIQSDPYVGTLSFFRVYSGSLKRGSYVLNTSSGEKERIGRLLRMHADEREEVEEAFAGDILATVGLKNTATGHTLCDENHPIALERITFPEPVISVRVEPKTKADLEKLTNALKKFSQEDPTFKVKEDPETSQTIISGMGELHLEIIIDRMRREFKVDCLVGKPEVAFKETILKEAEAEGKYIRQSGGRGQYGHVIIKISPRKRGEGFEFIDAIKGGVIPKEFIPAVKKGLIEAMEKGVLAGYPIVDISVTLFDGSFHEVDSSELAFKIAAAIALQEAVKKANPVLLEPIMKLEVICPSEFFGPVMGDIGARRGKIEETEDKIGVKIIRAKVPLVEMFGYATTLRSLTQGRGTFTMEFDHYDIVPQQIAQQIIEGRKNKGQTK
jgi:elongation factor G